MNPHAEERGIAERLEAWPDRKSWALPSFETRCCASLLRMRQSESGRCLASSDAIVKQPACFRTSVIFSARMQACGFAPVVCGAGTPEVLSSLIP